MKYDGRALALQMYDELKKRVDTLKAHDVTPHLSLLLVGDNPASKAYIAQKKKWGKYIGAEIQVIHFPEQATTEELHKTVLQLNTDASVHGIIAQRPLPEHIDKEFLAAETVPVKDIDGFHPNTTFVIPVAAAVVRILEEIYPQTNNHHGTFQAWLQTSSIVTIGKGDTAGKPIIDYLRKLGAHPTVLDSHSEDPDASIRSADIVISSVGKQRILRKDNIKHGAILIGVGITKDREEGTVGDYDESEITEIASYYTPTPGGVGPVNVAYLLTNLVTAAEQLNP